MPFGNPAIPRHFLYPGTLFVHRQEHLVTTVLGSCISVCMHDRERGVGGINHYLLAFWNGEGLPTPRYGTVAIERLLQKMLEHGARRENVTAKFFGGATIIRSSQGMLSVGERNIMLADELMEELGIRVICSDVGGTQGRKIIFNTRTGVVYMGKKKGND